MNSNSVTIIQKGDREFLNEVVYNGFLTGEVERRCLRLLREDEKIKSENDFLRGVVDSQRATIRHFQMVDLEARNYAFERREGYRMNRGFRLIVGFSAASLLIAFTCLVFNAIML